MTWRVTTSVTMCVTFPPRATSHDRVGIMPTIRSRVHWALPERELAKHAAQV